MATPPRFTVTMLHWQLRLPTTFQRARNKTPVQPSHPPPQHLLNARPKATAKASGGGGASSFGAKRRAVGKKGKGAALKDTSKAAKINLTEYLARNKLKRIRREWHAQFEGVAHDRLGTWRKCINPPRYRCQEEGPPPPSCSTRSPSAWSTSSWLWSIQARRLASGRTRPRGALLTVGWQLRRSSQHRSA